MIKNKNQNIKELFGKKIKYYRMLNDLTQGKLAHKIGRTEETISNIERGLNSTKLEVIENIAEVLSIDISDLFNFSQETTIKDKENFTLIKEIHKILNKKDQKYLKNLLGVLKNQ